MNKLMTVATGASGLGASELVHSAVIPNLSAVNDATTIIVQILIGIATLVGLFRKKKSITP